MTSSNGNIFALLAFCAGNSPVTGEFPTQRPVTRSFDVFFGLRLNKLMRRYRAHYDVTVMVFFGGLVTCLIFILYLPVSQYV